MLYPDTLVGADSHTTLINGLGILGWGMCAFAVGCLGFRYGVSPLTHACTVACLKRFFFLFFSFSFSFSFFFFFFLGGGGGGFGLN